MGQKTEFFLKDWEFPEENISTSIYGINQQMDSSVDESVLTEAELTELEQGLEQVLEIKSTDTNVGNVSIDKKGVILDLEKASHQLSLEEDIFRKQIVDLFELLELEQASDKQQGIRVYQTDSSPLRPWRFH